MHGEYNSENLEVAISKHAYGRIAIKLKDLEKAEQALTDALRIAKNYCEEEADHYEALVIKRTFGHFLCTYKRNRFDEGLKYLREALDGKLRLFENKPHQAIIGTIEPIVDVYAQNPHHKELKQLILRVTQYLDNWATAIDTDDSKLINKKLMEDRIYALKETINKVKGHIK